MTTPVEHEVFENSVKWDGVVDRPASSPIYAMGQISVLARGGDTVGYPEWSIYPHYVDSLNRRMYKREAAIAGAVYTFASRISSMEYTLGGNENKHKLIRDMLNNCDEGNGFKSLITKTVVDMVVNNNGAFWELVGDGNYETGLLSMPVGVNHLDSQLCYRTGNREYPVVYRNPQTGRLHKLHRSRVVSFSIMPQPDDLGRNVGFSPVSRMMHHVELMREITEYRHNKVSGSFTKAIGWIQGVPPAVLSRFVRNSGLSQASSETAYINNIPFLASLKDIKAGLLNLASIPDGFQLREEYDIYIYLLALCFGVDAREFWTATQTGATKADATVQHMKSRGKGFADVLSWIEQAVIRFLIPEDTTFEFDFSDDEFDSQVAAMKSTIAQTYMSLADKKIINKKTAEAHLIHHGILLPELIEEDDEDEETTPPPMFGATPFPPSPVEGEDEETQPVPTFGDEEDDEEDEDEETAKAKKTLETYRFNLRAAARGLYNGLFDIITYVNNVDLALRRGMTEAWHEGAAKAGLLQGDLTTQEVNTLQSIITEQSSYVMNFALYIEGAKAAGITLTKVFERVDLWLPVYTRTVDMAYLSANADGKSLWERDASKDSCIDCVTYDGRVYRNSIWDAYGIYTQSRSLACKGYRCGCTRTPTDKPITRGRPPAMSGAA